MFTHYARVCSDVIYFNKRYICIAVYFFSQGFRHHKLLKTFSIIFFHQYNDWFESLVEEKLSQTGYHIIMFAIMLFIDPAHLDTTRVELWIL